jgi:hypothetical protein
MPPKPATTTSKELLDKLDSFPWDTWNAELKSGFKPLYVAGVKVGAQVADGVGDVVGGFDDTDPFISDFINDYVGERIVQLTGTTKDRVISLIRGVLDKQELESPISLGKLIFDVVSEQFDGYKRWRANTIARTEAGFATNHGTVLATKQAGFDSVDVTDGDSDEECEAANGAVWSIEEALTNALEHPNCVRAFAPHVE